MIRTFQSFEEYHQACKQNPGLSGLSPSATAATMNLGQQGVYTACRRGGMDLVRVFENGRGPFLFVTAESVARYRETSLGKVGISRARRTARESLQERFIMAKDKIVHEVWPSES